MTRLQDTLPKEKFESYEKWKALPQVIGTFFLDSGAHSLYSAEVMKKKLNDYSYYRSKEFWKYVDTYARWVKKHMYREDGSLAIDYYVNVDVIFNPEMSWEVLKYLENEHGLHPVPVIHHGAPLKWVTKHLEAGYDLIGLGGLGQEVKKDMYYDWADRVYSLLCPGPSRLPIVRTHGFAMTAYELMIRYPWWSVDSASWVKAGGFGMIYVPRKSGGQYDYRLKPYNLSVSQDSPTAKVLGRNVTTLTAAETRVIREWLELIDVPFGKVEIKKKWVRKKDPITRKAMRDDKGEFIMVKKEVPVMVEWGVISHHAARKVACLRFFEGLVNWLPKWPWAFRGTMRPQFDISMESRRKKC